MQDTAVTSERSERQREKHVDDSGEKKLTDLFSLYFLFLVFVFVFFLFFWRRSIGEFGGGPSVCNVYVFYHYCPLGKKKTRRTTRSSSSSSCCCCCHLFCYAALLPRRGRILRRTLSVRLSVRPSRYRYRASRRAT